MRLLLFASILAVLAAARAQETPAPSATPVPRLVRLHFVPPPLEGTISLGIYDPAGKLVRVLHREETVDDFTAGHDALETTWDGNDDTGHPLPSGKYRARGFLVGELKTEGVEYFFNDWVTDDDSPHLAHLSHLSLRDESFAFEATLASGQSGNFFCDPASGKVRIFDPSPADSPNDRKIPDLLINPVAWTAGKEGTLWAITHTAKGAPGVEVAQLKGATILRKLAIAPNDPQPVGIAASPNEDRIYLLEEAPGLQRVRSLTLLAPAAATSSEPAVSDWKIDFEKKIVAHRGFVLENGKPIASPNESSEGLVKISQKLRPNPLERDQPGKVELAAGYDADGSYLQTADGLPLRTISDTPNLARVLIARQDGNSVDFFQDDGAVVEQFRVSHLEEMMAFDCGNFELK